MVMVMDGSDIDRLPPDPGLATAVTIDDDHNDDFDPNEKIMN